MLVLASVEEKRKRMILNFLTVFCAATVTGCIVHVKLKHNLLINLGFFYIATEERRRERDRARCKVTGGPKVKNKPEK